MHRLTRTPRRRDEGRTIPRLLADFGHDLPRAPVPEPGSKEPRLFRHASRRGTRGRDGGWAPLARVVERATVALCAEMCGGAQRVLDMTTEYAKIRIAFGRPIGAYQGVKHRAADMLVDVENAKSLTYYAAWAMDEHAPDAALAASMAKAYVSDAYRKVAGAGIQLHGGIGFTWEHDLHFYLKRAQYEQLAFGDATAHRSRLGSLLRARVEAGESVV